VFTVRYGLMPYMKQITFRLLKVNIHYAFSWNLCMLIIRDASFRLTIAALLLVWTCRLLTASFSLFTHSSTNTLNISLCLTDSSLLISYCSATVEPVCVCLDNLLHLIFAEWASFVYCFSFCSYLAWILHLMLTHLKCHHFTLFQGFSCLSQ
jgi:hypothetical protein